MYYIHIYIYSIYIIYMCGWCRVCVCVCVCVCVRVWVSHFQLK